MAEQVFRCKWTLVGEIVIEAIFDDWANGDLRLGKQLLDCIGKQVGRRVTNDIQAISILVGNDGQIDVFFNQNEVSTRVAIHLAGQRSAGQTGANTGCNLSNRDRIAQRSEWNHRAI
jgi:hypothetical protein